MKFQKSVNYNNTDTHMEANPGSELGGNFRNFTEITEKFQRNFSEISEISELQ